MTTIALLAISDNRPEYHIPSLLSVAQYCNTAFDQVIHVDDSSHALGFAGAVQQGWSQVKTDFVFHLETDFTFNRDIPLGLMCGALAAHPYLVQMALLRQPWNASERAAGGIIQEHPDSYTQVYNWLEHRRFITTNPCVFPRWVVEREFPQISQAEGLFAHELFNSDPNLRAAFWGHGEEWVTHIGAHRTGTGY